VCIPWSVNKFKKKIKNVLSVAEANLVQQLNHPLGGG